MARGPGEGEGGPYPDSEGEATCSSLCQDFQDGKVRRSGCSDCQCGVLYSSVRFVHAETESNAALGSCDQSSDSDRVGVLLSFRVCHYTAIALQNPWERPMFETLVESLLSHEPQIWMHHFQLLQSLGRGAGGEAGPRRVTLSCSGICFTWDSERRSWRSMTGRSAC